MNYFDIIRELKNGIPDRGKVARTMKVIGGICLFAALWNYFFPYIFPIERFPFKDFKNFQYWALGTLSFCSALFFYSSHCIKNNDSRGIIIGQGAILILIITCVYLFASLFDIFNFTDTDNPVFSGMIAIFSIIMAAQFGIPAILGIRYLQRLKDEKKSLHRYEPDKFNNGNPERYNNPPALGKKYKDSLLPFGIHVTFFLILGVPMIILFMLQAFFDIKFHPLFFIPVFGLIFFGPMIYNNMKSPFEQGKKVIKTYTGGGSITFFQGSWPFFRLIIYDSGLEIRVMFHRFFLPYEYIENIDNKSGFFNRGVYIQSNIPEVPSGIRFYGFDNDSIKAVIRETKNTFLNNQQR